LDVFFLVTAQMRHHTEQHSTVGQPNGSSNELLSHAHVLDGVISYVRNTAGDRGETPEDGEAGKCMLRGLVGTR
jgi:hypothetical protein